MGEVPVHSAPVIREITRIYKTHGSCVTMNPLCARDALRPDGPHAPRSIQGLPPILPPPADSNGVRRLKTGHDIPSFDRLGERPTLMSKVRRDLNHAKRLLAVAAGARIADCARWQQITIHVECRYREFCPPVQQSRRQVQKRE